MTDKLATFTDANWETEVLGSAQPVLVDFWADWCRPCHALAPAVASLAEQYAGRVKVGKMNVEENPLVPDRYAIRSLPTLLLFKGGQVADQRVGLVSQDALVKLVEPHIQ